MEDGFTWATSREYLLANNICDKFLCLEYDMTPSIEMMWSDFTSKTAAETLLASITDMELHLSDEARGLNDIPPENPPEDPPVVDVPEPSPLILLGLGLLGFGFMILKKA